MMCVTTFCNSESEEVVQENQVFCWNPSISGTKSETHLLPKKMALSLSLLQCSFLL